MTVGEGMRERVAIKVKHVGIDLETGTGEIDLGGLALNVEGREEEEAIRSK
jgi:hypothetical protein